jgi:hypothetical protein
MVENEGLEVVVSHSERTEIRPVSAVRGMWICTTQQIYRQRDLFERYVAALPAALRTRLPSTLATEWVPADVVIAHQIASDSLGLSEEECELLGYEAAERTLRPSLAALLVRAAAALSSSPWTVLGQAHRLWTAAARGGGVRVVRLGDREAQLEIVGFGPFVPTRYARQSLRGILRAALTPFANQVLVHEEGRLFVQDNVGYRLTW